ncbi:hypothetical protein I4U23_026861 [Adineta vaga]|nr:hypothetical protein I4U23_026861 [Adineta vaga]
MKLFENLSPIEYLEKYCRVSNRRFTLYKRIFDKHKDFDLTLVVEILPDTLVDVYMDTIDKRLINQAIRVLDLPINTKITFAQFRGIAAFSERYFFNLSPQSICANSRLNKDVLELLDFSCLEWKLIGVKISSQLRDILKIL